MNEHNTFGCTCSESANKLLSIFEEKLGRDLEEEERFDVLAHFVGFVDETKYEDLAEQTIEALRIG